MSRKIGIAQPTHEDRLFRHWFRSLDESGEPSGMLALEILGKTIADKERELTELRRQAQQINEVLAKEALRHWPISEIVEAFESWQPWGDYLYHMPDALCQDRCACKYPPGATQNFVRCTLEDGHSGKHVGTNGRRW